jgi:hypothetical protein
MAHMPSRWTFEAEVAPDDKPRLRSFIRNEISYYNGVLAGFAPWLRTSPEIFATINEALLGEMAALGVSISSLTSDNLPKTLEPYRAYLFDENGRSSLDERTKLLLGAVGNTVSLHPATRRALVVEMVRTHRSQAEDMMKKTSGPITHIQPHDGRVKRHVQLVNRAVVVDDGKAVRSAYNAVPIKLHGVLPTDAKWNVCIIREGESNDRNKWGVEFRYQEKADYLLRLTDPPLRQGDRAPPGLRGARNRDATGVNNIRGARR